MYTRLRISLVLFLTIVVNVLPSCGRAELPPAIDGATTLGEGGSTVYTPANMQFLEGQSPDTVNPSLWRQAQFNALLLANRQLGERPVRR